MKHSGNLQANHERFNGRLYILISVVCITVLSAAGFCRPKEWAVEEDEGYTTTAIQPFSVEYNKVGPFVYGMSREKADQVVQYNEDLENLSADNKMSHLSRYGRKALTLFFKKDKLTAVRCTRFCSYSKVAPAIEPEVQLSKTMTYALVKKGFKLKKKGNRAVFIKKRLRLVFKEGVLHAFFLR